MRRDQYKYRILILVPYTYPDYSGSGRNAFNFARYLNNNGIKAKILSFNRKGRYKSNEIKDQVSIKRVLYYNQNIFTKIFSLILIFPVYIKELCNHDIILIYGAHIIGYEFVISLGKLLGKKVIFQSLLIGEDDLEVLIRRKWPIFKTLYRAILKKPDIYHAINKEFTGKYISEFHTDRKVLELPQGVDIDLFRPVDLKMKREIRKRLGLNEDDFVMLTVGFLISRKGFSEIFTRLSTLNLSFKYVIVGEYQFDDLHFLSYEKEITDKLYNDGKTLLKDKLIFTGPKENVQEYFQASDLFLLNSSQEGLPNSLLEAMSVGIPVLLRDLPGIEGFVISNHKNGFVFKDLNEMKDIILHLYKSQKIRKEVGKNARETIERLASFENVIKSYEERLIH